MRLRSISQAHGRKDKKMEQAKLKEILEKHKKWLYGKEGGEKADLRGANLSCAILSSADLSCATGLLNPIDYLAEKFERTEDGYVVYKVFNGSYASPTKWKVEPGEIITEEVNFCRANECGCGINAAPLEWVKRKYPGRDIYKLLIKWEWLAGVVVPYNTDGKIRCARAQIIGKVENDG